MPKKILIIGSSVNTGLFLKKNLKEDFMIKCWSSKTNLKDLNLQKLKKFNIKKKIINFDVIIYCSALSNFSMSDKKVKLGKFINFDFIKIVIDNINSNQKLIYFSSFGVKSKFKYLTPNFIKYKTKIESYIKKKLINYSILRPVKIIDTMNVFKSKKNVSKWVFYENKFIFITNLKTILRVVKKIILDNYIGEINIGSSDKISMYNIAKTLLDNKCPIKIGKMRDNFKYNFSEPRKIMKNKNFNFIYKKAKSILLN